MKNTPNYGLKKPEETDLYNIEHFNTNSDILDAKLKELADSKAPVASPSFTGQIKNGDHSLYDYQIPGEDTKVFKVKRTGDSYTVLEVTAPDQPDGNKEATLTLMRHADPDTGGAEFLDLYNMNYPDGKQMGIRVQSRGGILRDFVFDFNAGGGNPIFEAMRILTTADVKFANNILMSNNSDQVISFTDASGAIKGLIGKAGEGIRISNATKNSVLNLQDEGNILGYTPVGDYYFYTDSGNIYFNDNPMCVMVSVPVSSTSPGTVGMMARDTNYLYICTAKDSWKRIAFDTEW